MAGRKANRNTKPAKSVEDTTKSILEASRSEFAKHGFAGTRIDAIARRAKVNKQALYYHFGSKEKLYRRVLEDGYRKIYSFIESRLNGMEMEKASPPRAVEGFIQAFFDGVVEHPDILDIITDENKYRGKHLKGSQVAKITNPFVHQLMHAIERGVQQGLFREDVDAEEVWISTVAVCRFWWNHRYTLSHNLGRNVTDAESVRRRREHVVSFVLAALYRQRPIEREVENGV